MVDQYLFHFWMNVHHNWVHELNDDQGKLGLNNVEGDFMFFQV